jgi:uncharacterized coiled-coil protein SlyX
MNIPKELIEQWVTEGLESCGYVPPYIAQRASEWTMQQLVGVDMEPVAVALVYEGGKRLCLSTVFDTMEEAKDYAGSAETVPLYTATQLAAAQVQGADEAMKNQLNIREYALVQQKRIAELEAENANLCTVMMAAAVEIQEHWDAHCDAEGYGPANLVRRLENGYPEQYGYDAQTMVRQDKRIAELEAQLAEAKRSCEWWKEQFDATAELLGERSKKEPDHIAHHLDMVYKPERIIIDANGRKHITTEPLLHPKIGCVQHDCDKCKSQTAEVERLTKNALRLRVLLDNAADDVEYYAGYAGEDRIKRHGILDEIKRYKAAAMGETE